MKIVDVVSERGTCDRGRTAAIVVKDNRILATGYVGSPAGIPHCDEVGHEMQEITYDDGSKSKHCVRTIHAELNAIAQAAKLGISIDGATMYMKMEPCYTCAKVLVNTGIKRVVALKRYHRAQRTRELFKEAGVQLDVLTDEEMEYSNKK